MFKVRDIKEMVESEKYLFHITSKEGMEKILNEERVRAMTETVDDGDRCVLTASFTCDPIMLMESGWNVFYEDKNIILVFDKQKLMDRGIFEVRYVSSDEYDTSDYTMDEEHYVDQLEWRSLNDVDINSCYLGRCFTLILSIPTGKVVDLGYEEV